MSHGDFHFQFPRNDTDEDEGLSDAGIETFKGVPYSSVARETGQNSRDAAIEFPVRMEFDVIEIQKSDFPNVKELEVAIEACAKRATERDDIKEKQFFSRAKKVIQEPVLHCLRISDAGTTGLVGPCVAGKPFHSLVKASGVSKKNDPTSGGSYGIGKKAAFAVSELHTVFYATRYHENGELPYLAQGKCTLVSHEQNGEKLRATGYWGRPKYMPIENLSDAPKWLRREIAGTTTYSIGFQATPDWKFRIAESLARNFFAAIHREELEFFVSDKSIHINKNSLLSVMSATEIELAAEAQGSSEDLEFSKQLYSCLVDPSTKTFETEIPNVGKFTLHLLVREGAPKRVAIIRNGMMITDNLQKFGDKLSHFPMYKDFVAIVEPSDDPAKTTVKRLENPEHNDLSADRIIEEVEQTLIRKGMNSLKTWIRASIKSEAFTPPKDEIALEEMNEFFGDVSNADRLPSKGDGDTNPLVVTYTPKKKSRQAPVDGNIGDEDDEGGGSVDANDGSGGDGTGNGAGGGDGDGGLGGETLAFTDFRNVRDPANPNAIRTILFTPQISSHARIKILANGMNNNVSLSGITVIDEEGVPVSTLKLISGVRRKLTVRLSADYQGPINMQLRKVVGDEG